MLLALNGRMTRLLLTRWLQEKGVQTHEASDWNELTLNLQEFFKARIPNTNSQIQYSETQEPNLESSITSIFIIFIDIGLLDLSTELWKQQLNFLEEYCAGRANFAWILNHDTSNAIKAELRRRGHLLMVNRPLYKAKLIQIFEAVIKRDRDLHLQTPVADGQFHEFLEIDPLQSPSVSSDDSEKSENESCTVVGGFHAGAKRSEYLTRAALSQSMLNDSSADYTRVNLDDDVASLTNPMQGRAKERYSTKSNHEEDQGAACSHKVVNEKKALEGLCILLAEDTVVLQRVATIMLEKMGAKVVVVGDGLQAVDSLKEEIQSNEYTDESLPKDAKSLPYDLILMDCQVS